MNVFIWAYLYTVAHGAMVGAFQLALVALVAVSLYGITVESQPGGMDLKEAKRMKRGC